MRALLVALLLLTALLAGCSGGGKDDGGGTSTATSSSATSTSRTSTKSSTATTSSSGTGTTAPANHPPLAGLSAQVNGTTVRFNVTGTDEDGDALAWTLAFGDGASFNGTQLPGEAEHKYASAGAYTANVTVSDGHGSASKALALNLTSGAAAVLFTGTITASDPSAAADQGCAYAAAHLIPMVPFPDNFGYLFTLPSGVGGWSFAFDVAGLEADFIDAAGNVPAHGASGTVPAEATQVAVCGADPAIADQDFVLALTPP